MEQVITVRIIDSPQSHNGETIDVFADRAADEIIVTDTPHDPDALGDNVAAGILALRGHVRQPIPFAVDQNIVVLSDDVPICPSSRLRGLLPPDHE